ncbi:PWWP domain-containing DNA repair factor 3A isoform X2 [Rana temporaria]|uniref:PWWP domain-containing DNA repair factor 3A isoform X2 n=1 Tax=Rana temporaria TaxID=8407 RepID=UPI001AADE928|nr:PWWP domain-containing DNA repair factor 3A isoform X2 [Rana temporaria]XP_040179573.1 PWWP domain-containing DNA repair factor 3A isoform X2 [Rana temporaria]
MQVLTKLEQPLSKNSKLQVEIFEELKQTSVKYSDTKPFLMVELKKISDDLDRSKNLKVTAEELEYRRALGTAMNLLKEVSAGESALLQNDRNTATIEACKEAVKHEGGNECTSSRKNLMEKEASGSIMLDGKTLKRDVSMRITKCSMRLRTPNKPKPTQTEIDVKRKRVEDTSTEKGSFRGGKKTPKIVSVDGSTTEQNSEKGKTKKAKLKRHLSSTKEMQTVASPDPEENPTRNVNRRTKCLVSKPSKTCNVQVPTTIQEFRSDTEEEDSHRKRKYNQLPLPDFSFTETELSSDLSMECSSPEFKAIPEVWPNDDTEDDVDLPVIELKKEPVSFENGSFVWCKFKRYPYWPSLVKIVRHKEKRASIIFVEECLSDPNSQKQSFKVSLRTLKHYDCPEKQELLDVARKDYGKSVDWCDSLICDYRIRLGCGSFSGSFLQYCTSAISYPVRRECCKTKLNFPSICQEICDPVPNITDSDSHVIKKILPDRARASRDRANEKLVECIVKSRQAERHLKGILTGKKKSHWLEKFQSSNLGVECQETYIEDEEQAELVVGYLQMLCETLSIQSKKLMNGDQTKFILEVMFPEAVIFALSATEGLSFEKAEKKFLAGPLLSKRERKQFEKQIMDKKRIKLEGNL